jgi:hypothetical protein
MWSFGGVIQAVMWQLLDRCTQLGMKAAAVEKEALGEHASTGAAFQRNRSLEMLKSFIC